MPLPFQLLVVLSFALQARCLTTAFIYPPVSNPSVLGIFNATVRDNDTMIVEYTKFQHTSAISMGLSCYLTAQEALGNQTAENANYYLTYLSLGPFENTGSVERTFNITAQTYFLEPYNVCQFLLFNDSIANCSWGPWGLTSLAMTEDLRRPLSYSPIFDYSLEHNRKGIAHWINEEDATASSTQSVIPITSTMNVTCPPSGIPAVSNAIVRQTDIYPPLATGLAFPSNPDYMPYVSQHPIKR